MAQSNSRDEHKKLEWTNEDDWLFGSASPSEVFVGEESFDQAAKHGQELDDYIEEMQQALRLSLDLTISEVAPWFFSAMPHYYYETTPRDEKIRDLRTIITGRVMEQRQQMQLWSLDRARTTFLGRGDEDNVLDDIAEKISGLTIKHGTTIKSNDNRLLISTFNVNPFRRVETSQEKTQLKLKRTRELLEQQSAQTADIDEFIENLDHDTVMHSTPARLARLFLIGQKLTTQEYTVSNLIPQFFKNMARFDVAYKNMPIDETLSRLLSILKRYDFKVHRCIATVVNHHKESPVSVFTFLMEHKSKKRITDKFVPFLKANKAAKTLKWVDNDQFDLFMKEPLRGATPYSLNEANLLRSISSWVHIFLSKTNPYSYSEERIFKTYRAHTEMVMDLVKLFRARFDPLFKGDRERKAKPILKRLQTAIKALERPVEQDIFTESTNFVSHILKTNYFTPKKTGLSFRMDPDCLDADYYPNKPFGIFYMAGRGYRAFQVRFRDTARGGLRIVMPRDTSQYEASIAGLFDEVIGLAYAQQMKNKDIPEGGSKAVLVLAPGAKKRNAAIGAVDSLLNLITTEPETGKLHPTIVDHYGEEEYVYLGPDENVTNDLIDKFIGLAHNQGYRYANAFMSSKPGAGINHKEYGVTSEGVNVFLRYLLGELNIDPTNQSFSVKMTGGPDGDVAGNMLKFLHRDYGTNPRITAIADGFGAAYDPNGLAWPELLRLVNEERPICDFDSAHLSGGDAFVIKADTVEHIKTRNQLFAKVVADVFIPAGGRPYTVHDKNWSIFLDKQGVPTAKAVVEGANIFFTEKAREELQNRGCLFFKDSSANKCGVICSSFEILASLLLSPEEFLEIKAEYVEQVITKLRSWAGLEAQLLLKEYRERGNTVNLVDLSKELSKVINRVTDLVAVSLEALSDDAFNQPLYTQIIMNYMPQAILDRYADRVLRDLPRSYQRALVSAEIASSIVYTEGIAWLDQLPDHNIPQTIMTYVQKEQKVKDLIRAVENAKLSCGGEISEILKMTGARAMTLLELADS